MKAVPVAEVFGPTIQGEGPDAGRPCLFVRFGGCDYSCSWCDSLHAVLPASVRKLPRLQEHEVYLQLADLVGGNLKGMTVVFSGGNPVLHDLGGLVHLLHEAGARVTVETQGSRWKEWLDEVDLLVVSPKPPSSGMVTNWNELEHVVWSQLDGLQLGDYHEQELLALKVVVGDGKDYEYARVVRNRFPTIPLYLSVLNPAGSDGDAFDVGAILLAYRALCEVVAHDPEMRSVRVMPQLHTLAWGAEMGR